MPLNHGKFLITPMIREQILICSNKLLPVEGIMDHFIGTFCDMLRFIRGTVLHILDHSLCCRTDCLFVLFTPVKL